MSEEIANSPYTRIVLLDAVTADGNGDTETIPLPVNPEGMRAWTLFFFGTWGGGTAKLQISSNGTNWIDVPNSSATADAVINVEFKAPFARAVLSGATSPVLTGHLI